MNISTVVRPLKTMFRHKIIGKIPNRYAKFHKSRGCVSILTFRERQVLLELIKNANVPKIADQLNLSPFTIIFYLNNIQCKLL